MHPALQGSSAGRATPDQQLDPGPAIQRALEHLASRQNPDGSWCGDYGGPMFLLPMYVAATHAGGHPVPQQQRRRMIDYIRSVQHADGSVGLHAEAVAGCMFTTVLCYVALRLLGCGADEDTVARMGRWIRTEGGALGAASWGKFTLALLNLYPYEGLHPVTPELWLLPAAFPAHPSRMWCHCRQVYLPMAWLYGRRAAIPEDDLVRQLRQEIYATPYEEIRFAEHRDTVYPGDAMVPHSWPMRLANRVTGLYERVHPRWLREAALSRLLDHIDYEDRATSFIRIGPVNAVLNTFVHLFHEPGGPACRRSFETLESYLWHGHDGVKMNGYNSCALWDTAFAVQAMVSTKATGLGETLQRAHDFIRDNQVLEDLPQDSHYHRHSCRGGWPFSNRAHGWPITDCTAEGLKAALALEQQVAQPVPVELMQAAVELIQSFQNPDGSWSTYERKRAGDWLEWLNPSQVFSAIMVDYGYVECTSACIQALVRARARFHSARSAPHPSGAPPLRALFHFARSAPHPSGAPPLRALTAAIHRGELFLRRSQRPDGSFEGSWAVCFTYGTWFGVWGLLAAGASPSDRAIQRACDFLERNQRADGGWGEDYHSCIERRYVPHRQGQVVNTAWALMTLVRAGRGAGESCRRAAQFLMQRQRDDGGWPREAMVGVFNKTTLISYDNYRRYFPLWALALYADVNRQAPDAERLTRPVLPESDPRPC